MLLAFQTEMEKEIFVLLNRRRQSSGPSPGCIRPCRAPTKHLMVNQVTAILFFFLSFPAWHFYSFLATFWWRINFVWQRQNIFFFFMKRVRFRGFRPSRPSGLGNVSGVKGSVPTTWSRFLKRSKFFSWFFRFPFRSWWRHQAFYFVAIFFPFSS